MTSTRDLVLSDPSSDSSRSSTSLPRPVSLRPGEVELAITVNFPRRIVRSLRPSGMGCTCRRMPRMQVYLPDDLYEKLKARGLPASELLQKAVRAEIRRQDLLSATDQYLTSLVGQVGSPTLSERNRANALANRIARRSTRKAG